MDKTSPIPLYLQLVDTLKEDIAVSKYKSSYRLLSNRELIKKHDVSQGTVTRALIELQRANLVCAKKGRGVFVRDPKEVRKDIKYVGVKIPELELSFYLQLLKGMEECVKKNGRTLTIYNASENDLDDQLYSSSSMGERIAGLIFSGEINHEKFCGFVRKNNNLPIVLLDFKFDQKEDIPEDIPYVVTDNREGAYKATEYLIKLGHKRIVHLGGVQGPYYHNARKRRQGYQEAMERHDLKPVVLEVGSCFMVGFNAFEAVMKLSSRPTAVLAMNDPVALGIMKALVQSGLKVPDSMSVIGFGGFEEGNQFLIPLTTVYRDNVSMGRLAAQMLLDCIEGKPVVNKVMPVKLIIRDSTRSPA